MAVVAIAVSTLAERAVDSAAGRATAVPGEGVAPGDREGGARALTMSAVSSLAARFLPYSSLVCCAVCDCDHSPIYCGHWSWPHAVGSRGEAPAGVWDGVLQKLEHYLKYTA